MKVLFYNIVDFNSISPYGNRLDYLADSLFHGFRSLLGENCVDYNKMEHMYKENFDKVKTDKCKGFTLYNRLDDIDLDRSNITGFDLVITPVHHSKHFNSDFVLSELEKLYQHYPKNKIAIFDGNDEQGVNYDWRKYGILFKRELSDVNAYNGVLPVSFSIPKDVIVDDVPQKELDFAPLIPCYLNRGMPQEKTYIYDDEEKYFNDYRRSLWGISAIKGGADCLRHYEIMACGCIPIFTDIELIPQNTMYRFPKTFLKIIKNNKEEFYKLNGNINYSLPFKPWDIHIGGHTVGKGFNKDIYNKMVRWLLEYTRLFLTTESVAIDIINRMKRV